MKKNLQESRDIFDVNSNLGTLYAQQNNLEKAEKYLNKSIKIDSKNTLKFIIENFM